MQGTHTGTPDQLANSSLSSSTSDGARGSRAGGKGDVREGAQPPGTGPARGATATTTKSEDPAAHFSSCSPSPSPTPVVKCQLAVSFYCHQGPSTSSMTLELRGTSSSPPSEASTPTYSGSLGLRQRLRVQLRSSRPTGYPRKKSTPRQPALATGLRADKHVMPTSSNWQSAA